MALVTLLTDFGTVDGYVGAMKGVIASLAPAASVVDLTHEVPPQDVRSGAWALALATRTFPARSIHVAVVDPGVGGDRRALVVRAADRLYVVPDNGLAGWVEGADEASVWVLDRSELFRADVSPTFHGRDLFASVAGRLAAGRAPDACGRCVASWCRLPMAPVTCEEQTIRGAVVHIDRFGNLVTNLERSLLGAGGRWQVALEARELGLLRRTYSDVDEGGWVAYLGGAGTVEIAVRNGSALGAGGRLDQEVRLWRA